MRKLELLTAEELARELRVTPSAVRNWTRQGLPARHFGRCVRFELREVLAWFEEQQDIKDGMKRLAAPHQTPVAYRGVDDH
jgi:excisionase family DNA binding protein